MASKDASAIPEFREFVSNNDQRLFDFCYLMLGDSGVVEETVLACFKDFGAVFSRMRGRKKSLWSAEDARISLFQTAWLKIQYAMTQLRVTGFESGRDPRKIKRFDDDLLLLWEGKREIVADLSDLLAERLGFVEADFRAPVVLRDILGFDDQVAARILGVRWGVYRHRLHRGRLDAVSCLRGAITKATPADTSGG